MNFILKKKGQEIYARSWSPLNMTLIPTENIHDAMHFSIKPVHVLERYDQAKEYEIIPLNNLIIN